jgi:hypothetical protein
MHLCTPLNNNKIDIPQLLTPVRGASRICALHFATAVLVSTRPTPALEAPSYAVTNDNARSLQTNLLF